MKVRILVLAESAYACITDDDFSLDCRLSPGKSAYKSMQESASDLRNKAERYLRDARRIEQAAELLKTD